MRRRKKPDPTVDPVPPRRVAKLDTGRYRKISVRVWGDERFCALSPLQPSGQGLFLYLLTSPATTSIPGLFRAGKAQTAEELGWFREAFDEAFREVSREGLATWDEKARVVWIPKATKHNVPESPNVVRSWRQHWLELPDCDLKVIAWEALRDFTEGLGEAFAKAFAEACPKPSPKTKANQEQEQEQEKRKEQPLPLRDPDAKSAPPAPDGGGIPDPPQAPPAPAAAPAEPPAKKATRIAPPRVTLDEALAILTARQPLLDTPAIRAAVANWHEHRRERRFPFDARYWEEQVDYLGGLGSLEAALEALTESYRNRYQALVYRGKMFHVKHRPRVRDNDFEVSRGTSADLALLFPEDGDPRP